MKLRNLVGDRFKERPADCVIDSHAFTIRGGYIKYVANGIYSLYPPMKRITRKIEEIIREEMDAIGGQEVLFPVALPAASVKNPAVLKVLARNFSVLKTGTAARWSWV